MTENPAEAISEALTEPGAVAPLTALGRAADWAREILSETGGDEDTALDHVIALYDTLPKVTRLMDLIPALVKAASPGAEVSERLAAARAELDAQQVALTVERERIEQARDLEERARELAAERASLVERIERLKRSQRVERELPALRERAAQLEAVVPQTRAADGDEVLRALGEAVRIVRELSEEQRSLLEEENGQLVSAVATAAETIRDEQDRRDKLVAELEQKEREAEQLRAEGEQRLPGLRARSQADEELLAGMSMTELPMGESAIERVRTELSEIEHRVENAEKILKPLLQQHARAYEEARKIRGLND